MLRVLVTAAALGLAVVTATPASAAVSVVCFSEDLDCQSYECPAGFRETFNNGVSDTGPWLVVCEPDL